MKSLGTTTVIEVTVPTSCRVCGETATYGLSTTNNPIKYFCLGDLKSELDTFKD